MGTVVDLERHRSRRRRARRAAPGGSPGGVPGDLDRIIRRLTPLVRKATKGARDHELETQLLAAIGAVATGLHDEAVRRLEDLAARLESVAAPSPK